jgi:hypothetical protein
LSQRLEAAEALASAGETGLASSKLAAQSPTFPPDLARLIGRLIAQSSTRLGRPVSNLELADFTTEAYLGFDEEMTD